LKHIHASENDRGLLGAGHVPFDEIIPVLREIGYEGYLMIEGFGYDKNEKNSPGRLWAHKDLSPNDLAQNGFKYLTQLLHEGTRG
jgi:D-psicose/D-tagatose/L-ribulose 3-epimerase